MECDNARNNRCLWCADGCEHEPVPPAEPWPAGFSITMGDQYTMLQNDWHFVVVSGDCSSNRIGLVCETPGYGTLRWEGTAQQLQQEFVKA